jgi:hypothetical protein
VGDVRESAGILVDCEDHDAVMTAIGPVEKLSRWGNMDVGARVRAGEILGESWDGFNLPEPPALIVVSESGECGVQFVDYVSIFAIWVEIEMARAGSRSNSSPSLIVRFQLPLGQINSVNHDFVQPEVGHKEEAIGCI